ncbi:MAG: DJ-1/PfpI family protein [Alphaproteobacteria bacterium]|jgi:cyclohexyl-isocyanide hydratase|nr:DJ-1/PfpI family protein [Alphaproteobacteria bacterium]MDP6564357.1 DJ-1/PfpI family protein [Alphaproteobacteria bacterium]MDP6812527.1 DJ-1/PfpI family protein [Alphaproteobacteria bacterium]
MAKENDVFEIGLLLFPGLTQLDLTGPYEVFARAPGARTHLIWKSLDPVRADSGLGISPTVAFSEAPMLDLICVPGGPGQVALMADDVVLDFLRARADSAQFVTSVCTGSLVLGAAGLLKGVQATCHWSSLDQLALLGAIPIEQRVVRDGRHITGAGVTSGIDFALVVVAEIFGAEVAKAIQLQLEYDPEPPFPGGSPKSAEPALVDALRQRMSDFLTRRREATSRAAERL